MRLCAQEILATLVIAAAAGPAAAACPDGRPEPCLQLAPLLGSPTLKGALSDIPQTPALVPQVQAFKLAAPPAVAAPVQLYIAATPSPTQQVLALRRRAAALLDQIHFEGFMVSFEGLKTVLSPNSPSSTDAEDHQREARRLLAQYLLVLRDIERINLGMRIGGENYDQRVAQVQVVQGRIDAVNVDLHPLYSVHRSDAAVHIEDPNPPRTPNCRTETVYESHIVNVIVSAGFDAKGNPVKRQGRDIERRPKQVTVCD